MFGNYAFQTWAVIFVGAVLFGGLFTMLGMMTELLFEGAFEMTRGAVGFGMAAFLGYVAVAVFLRDSTPPES